MCPTRLDCTSEDECKWFTAIWFILLKQAKQLVRYLDIVTQNTYYLHTEWQLFTVIMYSVHDESSLSRQTLLLVLLVASWRCSPLLCCWTTAYLAPRLEGRALPHSPLPGWPHFPQGPGTFPLVHRTHLIRAATYVRCCCSTARGHLWIQGDQQGTKRIIIMQWS